MPRKAEGMGLDRAEVVAIPRGLHTGAIPGRKTGARGWVGVGSGCVDACTWDARGRGGKGRGP